VNVEAPDALSLSQQGFFYHLPEVDDKAKVHGQILYKGKHLGIRGSAAGQDERNAGKRSG
jgi:hypothetical protein